MKKYQNHLSLLILSLFFAFSVGAQTGYKPGDEAMGFNLKNVDGKNVSLNDYKKSKGVIVIFTCNHCPFAKAYENRIIAINNAWMRKGFPVVAINPNDAVAYPEDGFDSMVVRAKTKNFSFPYLVDNTQKIASTYGATKTPHIFLLENKNGKFFVRYIGSIDDNANDEGAVSQKYLENAIQAIIAGKTPDPATTKAIGCGIKWAKKQ